MIPNQQLRSFCTNCRHHKRFHQQQTVESVQHTGIYCPNFMCRKSPDYKLGSPDFTVVILYFSSFTIHLQRRNRVVIWCTDKRKVIGAASWRHVGATLYRAQKLEDSSQLHVPATLSSGKGAHSIHRTGHWVCRRGGMNVVAQPGTEPRLPNS
jgi:hypothetical protein